MPEGKPKKPPRFGGPRVRTFAHKSRAGCITCKRRHVRCGQERPACKRCQLANRECEGYGETVKDSSTFATTSTHGASTPSTSTHESGTPWDDSFVLDPNGLSQGKTHQLVIRRSRCNDCGYEHTPLSTCPSETVSHITQPSSSPYRRDNEQYLFKFFVEVAAASVSRSDISAQFWLGSFPQVAYSNQSVRDCLLAVSAAFHEASDKIFNNDSRGSALSCLAYETRAMQALSRGQPTTYEVLNTSMAFWVTSMVVGDWGLSLQHLYHCLKIVTGGVDTSHLEPTQLRYMTALAVIGLQYFRTTRGTCKLHGAGEFLACEASCYTPENVPFPERVADALYHLRNALPVFELCLELLRGRTVPHSREVTIDNILQKQIREIRFLSSAWADTERMKLSADRWRVAQSKAPFTASPFEVTLANLIRYIVNDQHSTDINFLQLELQTRVAIPHLVASTSRGNPLLVEDSLALMYYGGYVEGMLKAKATWTDKHIGRFMDLVQPLVFSPVYTRQTV